MAYHLDAAGVGGDVAAYLAGARGGEVHRVEQALPGGKLLQLLGHHAGTATHGAVHRVKVAQLVEPVQGQHQFPLAGHGAGTEAGPAAGGHNGQALAAGQAHDILHLCDRPGQHHRPRRRGVETGPVTAVVFQGLGIGQHPVRPHNILQSRKDITVMRCHWRFLRYFSQGAV